MGRILLAALLLAHGVAHLPGFAVPWRLLTSNELPYRTTILAGRVDVGDTGVKALGLGWAALALLFIALAVSVWLRVPAARTGIVIVAAASLAMCVLGWPDAKIGIIANVIVLALLAFAV